MKTPVRESTAVRAVLAMITLFTGSASPALIIGSRTPEKGEPRTKSSKKG